MEAQPLRAGHFLALIGALGALASLWRPWYRVELPQGFRDALAGEAANVGGPAGQIAQGLAALLPGSLQATGWQALQGADVALCAGAVLAAALVVGAAGAFGPAVRIDAAAAGRGLAVLGGAGLLLCLLHAVDRPGGGMAADVVKLGAGLWLATAGCALVAVGGVLAARAPGA
jgi:hypothetical protein